MNGYDRITERIVALLEQGTVPWHKPWKAKTGLPRNLITKKPYRGVNVILLMSMEYESPFWLTYHQATELGGSVRKGEKSCPVVFWKPLKVADEESGDEKKIPLLRIYHVFNSSQCDGLKLTPTANEPLVHTAKPAEIVLNMPRPPAIRHGMARAYYSPSDDEVGMPDRGLFEAESGFDPSYRSVPRKTWYSASGKKMTGGGYSRKLKRHRMAVRGHTFNIATDFVPKQRYWWEGNGIRVPDAKLFMADDEAISLPHQRN